MFKIPCTVGILTFNSGSSLGQTLEAVRNFAEIIICDGGSIDNTLEIARRYGCKIINQGPKFKRQDGKINDFSGVRNQLLDSAAYKWFFYVDSDELLSFDLIEEISKIVSNPDHPAAFWVPRKYVVDGAIIDCASTYPSKQMRLFHRDSVNKFIKTIHERIEVKEGSSVLDLKNFMLVPMITDVALLQKKWNYYLDLEEEKRTDLTLWGWLIICVENLKVSTLYLYRLIRNFFFCRGKKMPLYLELQRHLYHINMCWRFLRKINF